MSAALLPFTLAAFALLSPPGPSNAYVANAGIAGGTRILPLTVVAVMLGYAITVGALTLGLGAWLEAHPIVARVLRVACAAYLVKVAHGLWREAASAQMAGQARIEGRHLFRELLVVTLLNPKGLVAGLALIPGFLATAHPDAATIMVAIFVGVAGVITALYTLAGSAVYAAGGSTRVKALLSRGSAIVIVVFAGIILWGAVTA